MRWKPDTCGCILEFNTVNEPSDFVSATKCVHHTNVPDNQLTQTILDENQPKNIFEGYLTANFPSLKKTVADVDDEGNILLDDTGAIKTKEVVDRSKLSWSFDKDRKIVFDVAISEAEKIQAKGHADNNVTDKIFLL